MSITQDQIFAINNILDCELEQLNDEIMNDKSLMAANAK